MDDKEIVFIDPYENPSYAYLIIRQALKEKGIKTQRQYLDGIDISKIKKNSVVAFSSNYQSLDKMLIASEIIKEFTELPIFWGGPGTNHMPTNINNLETGLVDGIVYKGPGPLIDLVSEVKYPYIVKEAANFGIMTQTNPKPVRGSVPRIEDFPLKSAVLFDGSTYLVLPRLTACPHNCDYCEDNGTPTSEGMLDDVAKAVYRLSSSAENKIGEISFNDPSISSRNGESRSVQNMRFILENIKNKKEKGVVIDHYMDSNDFHPENYDKTLALMDELNIRIVDIGVNAVTDKTARYVGRNLYGAQRTDIEKEVQGVLRAIRDDNQNIASAFISTLFSRGDDIETLQKTVSFFRDFIRSSGKTPVNIRWYHALPLPGTVFEKKHGNDYRIDSFSDYEISSAFDPSKVTYKSDAADFFSITEPLRKDLQDKNKLQAYMAINLMHNTLGRSIGRKDEFFLSGNDYRLNHDQRKKEIEHRYNNIKDQR